jgi:phosphate/sulfate permease
MDELLVGLAALLSFVFGWNNSSFLIGNLRGSGSLSFAAAILTAVAGLLVGTLLEGSKMGTTFVGSLAPTTTSSIMVVTLVVALGLTLALTMIDLPVSFSMIMVSAFLGATLQSTIPVNAARAGTVVTFWFVAPAATAALTFVIYASLTRFVSRLSLITVDSLNRAGGLVSGLAVAYTLGANNVGMIYASTLAGTSFIFWIMLLLAVTAMAGAVTFGRSALGGSIGDKMLSLSPQGVFSAFVSSSLLVWFGTQFALPVSISQCLLGGMFGAAYSRAFSAINRRLAGETVSVWLLAPLAAFGLAYLLEMVL